MSMLSVVNAEKKLLLHVQLGGSPNDEVGTQLVVKFARTAISEPQIAKIATEYQISLNDICIIYSHAIASLMPNPCICDGGPIQIENRVGSLLAPTLFFMEPYRFHGLASEIAARTRGMDDFSRKLKIAELAAVDAMVVKRVHDATFGPAKFHIEHGSGLKSAKGCVVLVGFLVIFAFGAHGLVRTVFSPHAVEKLRLVPPVETHKTKMGHGEGCHTVDKFAADVNFANPSST